MSLPKYMKPIARSIGSIEPAYGSCVTGRPEYPMTNCTATGDIALTTCVPGSVVYPPEFCGNGEQAGYSCVNGLGAG